MSSARTLAVPATRRVVLRRLAGGGLVAGLGGIGRGRWAGAQEGTPAATPVGATPAAPADAPIDHVVVIYLENHTFDNLYGFFPGANGLERRAQVIRSWTRPAWSTDLPPPALNLPDPGARPAFPADLPNAPFPIDQYVPLDQLDRRPCTASTSTNSR